MNAEYRILKFLLASLLFLSGCTIEKEHGALHIYGKSNKFVTPNGYTVAKPVKFKLKDKFQLTDTAILSTNFIYAETCYKEYWFKFYADGKVIFGNNSKIPTKEDDKCWGWGGYYKIDGTAITIEIAYTQESDHWANLFVEGQISGDTLKFYKDRYGKSGPNIHHFTSSRGDPQPAACHYFIKCRDAFKLKTPDW